MAHYVEEVEKEISIGNRIPLKRKILRILLLLLIGAILITAGIYLRWDKWIVGGILLLLGFLTQAWVSIISLIGGIPGVGHIIVRFIALPLLLIINGIGNMVAFFAIKMGYRREIMDTKLLTWVFILGAIIGFILGGLL